MPTLEGTLTSKRLSGVLLSRIVIKRFARSQLNCFDSRFAYYKDGNKESFKHALLGSIVKEEFDVLVEPGENGEDPIYRPSVPELEGIVSKYSVRLRSGYLPHTYNNPSYEK